MLKKERETAEKIAARAYTQQYLADLLPAVFTSLRGHGYFYDPVEKGQHSPPAVSSSISFLLSNTWGHCCTPLHTAEKWLARDEVIDIISVWVFFHVCGSDFQMSRPISSRGWWLRFTKVWRRDTQQERCWTVRQYSIFIHLFRGHPSTYDEQCFNLQTCFLWCSMFV